MNSGLGLILPGLSRIQPGLTVWAAAGLLIVMIAAAFWHLRRAELVNVLINLALVGLLGFLAYGRVRRSPLPGSFGALRLLRHHNAEGVQRSAPHRLKEHQWLT